MPREQLQLGWKVAFQTRHMPAPVEGRLARCDRHNWFVADATLRIHALPYGATLITVVDRTPARPQVLELIEALCAEQNIPVGIPTSEAPAIGADVELVRRQCRICGMPFDAAPDSDQDAHEECVGELAHQTQGGRWPLVGYGEEEEEEEEDGRGNLFAKRLSPETPSKNSDEIVDTQQGETREMARLTGDARACARKGCTNTFAVTPWQNNRKYCAACTNLVMMLLRTRPHRGEEHCMICSEPLPARRMATSWYCQDCSKLVTAAGFLMRQAKIAVAADSAVSAAVPAVPAAPAAAPVDRTDGRRLDVDGLIARLNHLATVHGCAERVFAKVAAVLQEEEA